MKQLLSASVYNRVLNYVLNHELNKNDSQLLEVNLLNQLIVHYLKILYNRN
ncbi:hypothetical protein GWG99_003014 [Enterococcus faecalis]|nr:hypothetical protein [Enterococcus faecalis]EGO6586250.1 hypothetical protein [Enterococcus faecalis]